MANILFFINQNRLKKKKKRFFIIWKKNKTKKVKKLWGIGIGTEEYFNFCVLLFLRKSWNNFFDQHSSRKKSGGFFFREREGIISRVWFFLLENFYHQPRLLDFFPLKKNQITMLVLSILGYCLLLFIWRGHRNIGVFTNFSHKIYDPSLFLFMFKTALNYSIEITRFCGAQDL